MKNIAIILAGGVGSRLGLSIPKQFFKVAGTTIIEHTVNTFETNKFIDEIYIVVHSQYIEFLENLCLSNKWTKVSKILNGGSERYESSLSAIKACEEEECNMIFHDSVRPLVSNRIINDVVEALKTHRAVDVAIPQTDTIIQRSGDFITDIPTRSTLYSGQTPQAFRLSLIREAYGLALKDPQLNISDDCGVVKKYIPQEPIFIVKGETQNMKITYHEDIFLLDKLFQIRTEKILPETKSDIFKDKVAVIFGGSYGIGAAIVEELRLLGCKVFSFSRSENNVDITSRENVIESLEAVYNETFRIDYVINSAAILIKKPLMSTSSEEVGRILDVNFTGMINVAQASHRYLEESKGVLLFFTSSSYTRGRAFYSLYSSTKAAAVNFVQAIAQEWDTDGIRVNCICPERTKTPMREKNFGIEDESTLLTAQQVAFTSIKALISEETGQVYVVNNISK